MPSKRRIFLRRLVNAGSISIRPRPSPNPSNEPSPNPSPNPSDKPSSKPSRRLACQRRNKSFSPSGVAVLTRPAYFASHFAGSRPELPSGSKIMDWPFFAAASRSGSGMVVVPYEHVPLNSNQSVPDATIALNPRDLRRLRPSAVTVHPAVVRVSVIFSRSVAEKRSACPRRLGLSYLSRKRTPQIRLRKSKCRLSATASGK